jgi:hypothetical protein
MENVRSTLIFGSSTSTPDFEPGFRGDFPAASTVATAIPAVLTAADGPSPAIA